MCREWLKVNGRDEVRASRGELTLAQQLEKYEKLSATSPLDMFGNRNPYYDPAAKPPRPTDLFGNPIPEPKRTRRSKRTQQRGTHQRPSAARPSTPSSTLPVPPNEGEGVLPLVRNMTDEEVASFKALGVEVCIESARAGDIWLVPEYQDETPLGGLLSVSWGQNRCLPEGSYGRGRAGRLKVSPISAPMPFVLSEGPTPAGHRGVFPVSPILALMALCLWKAIF
jgi:hypothetical protein